MNSDYNNSGSGEATGCWDAIKVFLMVCGGLFIALVILVIGICSQPFGR